MPEHTMVHAVAYLARSGSNGQAVTEWFALMIVPWQLCDWHLTRDML